MLRVTDDRIAVQGPKYLVTEDGPSSSTFTPTLPNDPGSLSPNFSIRPSSQASGINRQMLWKMRGQLTVTGTNLEALTSVAGRVAFRQFPLQSACDSCEVSLNDTTFTIGTLNQVLHGLLAKGTTSKTYGQELSLVNCCPDILTDYESAVGTPLFEAPSGNPYSDYTSGSRTKGALSISVAPAVAATSMVIDFELVEPLICAPFEYASDSSNKALFGVNTMQVTLNISNVHRMLSMAIPAGSTVSSVSLKPTYQALLTSFVTASSNSLFSQNERYYYGFVQPQSYVTPLSSAAIQPQETVGGSSNTIDFSVVPKGFLVFATVSESDRTNPALSIPSFNFSIESIQCSFASRSGLLSGATKEQLYVMSQRNGINLPAQYWLGQGLGSSVGSSATGAGGVLYIDCAADLSLPEGLSPGMAFKSQFSIDSIVVRNQTSKAYSGIRLFVVALTQGLLTNEGGSTVRMLGGVPVQNSDELEKLPTIMRSEVERLGRNGGYGGAVLGGKNGRRFMRFLRGLGKAAKFAAPIVERALPESRPYIESARSLLGGATRAQRAPRAPRRRPQVTDIYDLLE